MKISKILALSLGVFLSSLIVFSCSKDLGTEGVNTQLQQAELRSGRSTSGQSGSSRSSQDLDYSNLALVMSYGVSENTSLRALIKRKALEQFDGDYDVLITQIKDMDLQTASGTVSVKSYLGAIYDRLNLNVAAGANDGGFSTSIDPVSGDPIVDNPDDIIDFIVSVYPIVQVSVPVLAEEWDETAYVPTAVFIAEDYNEGVTKWFDGYSQGTHVLVDAENKPTDPVLVISNCERIRKNQGLRMTTPPDVDISLSASTSATGITLSWDFDNTGDDDIIGYRIYRRTTMSNNFTFYAENIEEDNKIYVDNNVDRLLDYFYYVKAYNAFGESESSNIASATAPDRPNPVSSFSASHLTPGEIELRWTNGQGQHILDTRLSRRIVGAQPGAGFAEIGVFPLSVNEYYDLSVIQGKRVDYKLVQTNNQGSSDPVYDFIKVPFRDVEKGSRVTVSRITYEQDLEGEIEGWGRGKPEIQLSVVKAGQSGDAAIVQPKMFFDLTSNNYVPPVEDRLVSIWLPSDWAEIYTFRAIEVDGGPKVDLSVSAGFEKKNQSKTAFVKGSVDVSIPDVTDTNNEEVGVREHRFTSSINSVLEYPNGGVKVHLSN